MNQWEQNPNPTHKDLGWPRSSGYGGSRPGVEPGLDTAARQGYQTFGSGGLGHASSGQATSPSFLPPPLIRFAATSSPQPAMGSLAQGSFPPNRVSPNFTMASQPGFHPQPAQQQVQMPPRPHLQTRPQTQPQTHLQTHPQTHLQQPQTRPQMQPQQPHPQQMRMPTSLPQPAHQQPPQSVPHYDFLPTGHNNSNTMQPPGNQPPQGQHMRSGHQAPGFSSSPTFPGNRGVSGVSVGQQMPRQSSPHLQYSPNPSPEHQFTHQSHQHPQHQRGPPQMQHHGQAQMPAGGMFPPNTGIPQQPISGFTQQARTGIPQQTSSGGFSQQARIGIPQTTDSGFPQQAGTGIPQQANTGIPQTARTGIPQQPNSGIPRQPSPRMPQQNFPQQRIPVQRSHPAHSPDGQTFQQNMGQPRQSFTHSSQLPPRMPTPAHQPQMGPLPRPPPYKPRTTAVPSGNTNISPEMSNNPSGLSGLNRFQAPLNTQNDPPQQATGTNQGIHPNPKDFINSILLNLDASLRHQQKISPEVQKNLLVLKLINPDLAQKILARYAFVKTRQQQQSSEHSLPESTNVQPPVNIQQPSSPLEDTSLIREAFRLKERETFRIPTTTQAGEVEPSDKAILGRWYAQPDQETNTAIAATGLTGSSPVTIGTDVPMVTRPEPVNTLPVHENTPQTASPIPDLVSPSGLLNPPGNLPVSQSWGQSDMRIPGVPDDMQGLVKTPIYEQGAQRAEDRTNAESEMPQSGRTVHQPNGQSSTSNQPSNQPENTVASKEVSVEDDIIMPSLQNEHVIEYKVKDLLRYLEKFSAEFRKEEARRKSLEMARQAENVLVHKTQADIPPKAFGTHVPEKIIPPETVAPTIPKPGVLPEASGIPISEVNYPQIEVKPETPVEPDTQTGAEEMPDGGFLQETTRNVSKQLFDLGKQFEQSFGDPGTFIADPTTFIVTDQTNAPPGLIHIPETAEQIIPENVEEKTNNTEETDQENFGEPVVEYEIAEEGYGVNLEPGMTSPFIQDSFSFEYANPDNVKDHIERVHDTTDSQQTINQDSTGSGSHVGPTSGNESTSSGLSGQKRKRDSSDLDNDRSLAGSSKKWRGARGGTSRARGRGTKRGASITRQINGEQVKAKKTTMGTSKGKGLEISRLSVTNTFVYSPANRPKRGPGSRGGRVNRSRGRGRGRGRRGLLQGKGKGTPSASNTDQELHDLPDQKEDPSSKKREPKVITVKKTDTNKQKGSEGGEEIEQTAGMAGVITERDQNDDRTSADTAGSLQDSSNTTPVKAGSSKSPSRTSEKKLSPAKAPEKTVSEPEKVASEKHVESEPASAEKDSSAPKEKIPEDVSTTSEVSDISATISVVPVKNLVISNTHKMTWIRFHGKVTTRLITPEGSFFLVKEIFRRCFRIQAAEKRAQMIKIQTIMKTVLKIKEIELDPIMLPYVIQNLKERKVIKTVPDKFMIISEDDAMALFHYIYKDKFCEDGCISPFYKELTSSVVVPVTNPSRAEQITEPTTPGTNSGNEEKQTPTKLKSPAVTPDRNIFDVIVAEKPSGKKRKRSGSGSDRDGSGRKLKGKDVIDLCSDSEGYDSDKTLPYVDGHPVEGLGATEIQDHTDYKMCDQAVKVRVTGDFLDQDNSANDKDNSVIVLDSDTEHDDEEKSKEEDQERTNIIYIHNCRTLETESCKEREKDAEKLTETDSNEPLEIDSAKTPEKETDVPEVGCDENQRETVEVSTDIADEPATLHSNQRNDSPSANDTSDNDVTDHLASLKKLSDSLVSENNNSNAAMTENSAKESEVVILIDDEKDTIPETGNTNKESGKGDSESSVELQESQKSRTNSGDSSKGKNSETLSEKSSDGEIDIELKGRTGSNMIPLSSCNLTDTAIMAYEKKVRQCIEKANKTQDMDELADVCYEVLEFTKPLEDLTKKYLSEIDEFAISEGTAMEDERKQLLNELALKRSTVTEESNQPITIDGDPTEMDNGT